jgi:hypothetical protein
MMKNVGFIDVRIYSWNFGCVVLHSARMPEQASERVPQPQNENFSG